MNPDIGWILLTAAGILMLIPQNPFRNPFGLMGVILIPIAVYIYLCAYFPALR
jgi:hypothetical protein